MRKTLACLLTDEVGLGTAGGKGDQDLVVHDFGDGSGKDGSCKGQSGDDGELHFEVL